MLLFYCVFLFFAGFSSYDACFCYILNMLSIDASLATVAENMTAALLMMLGLQKLIKGNQMKVRMTTLTLLKMVIVVMLILQAHIYHLWCLLHFEQLASSMPHNFHRTHNFHTIH